MHSLFCWPLCYVCNDSGNVFTSWPLFRQIDIRTDVRRALLCPVYLYLWSLSFTDIFVLNLFWCPLIYGSDCATHWLIACSRLSDSEEDAKVKGTKKKWRGRKKEKGSSRFIFVFADPTISEPETG